MDTQIGDNMPRKEPMKNKHLTSKQSENPPEASAAKPRAKFSDEFKRTAVARLRESGTNATLLALELGIRRNQLYKWAKAIEELPPDKSLRSPGRPPVSEENEIARLRRELAEEKQKVAILKKFSAYLTRPK